MNLSNIFQFKHFFLKKKHLFKNIIQEKVERIIYAVFEVN